MINLPQGIAADHDGDMPSFTPITFTLAAFSTKYRRKVKRGPGRGRKVRIKVFISRSQRQVIDPPHRLG